MMPTRDLESELASVERQIIRMKHRMRRTDDPEERVALKTKVGQLGDLCKDYRRKIMIRQGLLRRP
jgi:hypothetical protein